MMNKRAQEECIEQRVSSMQVAIWDEGVSVTLSLSSTVASNVQMLYVTGFAKTVPNGTRIEIQFIA